MATEHAADNDIRGLISIDISNNNLSTDSGGVISKVRDPVDRVFVVAV